MGDGDAKIAQKVRYSVADEAFVNPRNNNLEENPVQIKPYIYYTTLLQIKRELPFDTVCGKISPYTKQPIKTPDEYNTYCSCLALKRTCELKLREMDKELAAAKAKEFSALVKASAADRSEREARRQLALGKVNQDKYKGRIKLLKILVVLLCLTCVAMYSSGKRSQASEAKQSAQTSAEGKQAVGKEVNIEEQLQGDSSAASTATGSEKPDGYESTDYIGNKKSHKFHKTTCSYLPDSQNQRRFKSRDSAIAAGYEPCGKCSP